jgi:hypothetical protein
MAQKHKGGKKKMATAAELLRQGRTEELWQKYCGFIDLSLEEFMEIQERLLMEQIGLLSKCELGHKLLGDRVPTSVDEFRARVPLTIYEDYLPYLDERREDVLPSETFSWVRTSGRSQVRDFRGYECKWIPYPRLEDLIEGPFAAIIFAAHSGRGEFPLREGDKFLYVLAPPPFASSLLPHALAGEFPFKFLPPIEEAEKMSFQERMEEGFHLAFREGLDVFYGLSSVLVKIGERFEQELGSVEISSVLLHPKSLWRLIKGLVKSKLAKRPMLPKDLWSPKAIITGGMDTAVLKDKVEYYWGKPPIEAYGAAEGRFIATQTWDREGMTFVPNHSFLEFIPEEEHIKSKLDPGYQPPTVLLDEVETGKKYEIVITNLSGGIFVRYRLGDMIKIVALRNEKLGINTPQMVFEARCDDIIDLLGFTRLTESTIWQAIGNSGVSYEDWVVRKEIKNKQPVLHLYIELKTSDTSEEEVQKAVQQSLKDLDTDYRNLEEMLEVKPLEVTFLSKGTFQQYTLDRQAAGVDLAQLKPPHMQPSDEMIKSLLRFSEQRRSP